MQKTTSFLKKNALWLIIILGLLYVAGGGISVGQSARVMTKSKSNFAAAPTADYLMMETADEVGSVVYDGAAPSSSSERMVIIDTSLSLLVKNVTESVSNIESQAKTLGGFLVTSNVNADENEIGVTGLITIRVPADQRQEMLNYLKDNSIRVVSENVNGRDVTDQYEDIESKLAVYNATKEKFEKIQESAVTVEELLSVQKELVNLQRQIDNLKGRQDYLAKSADLSKITVHLATDELALPYTPADPWSPKAVTKEAIRSLIGLVRVVLSLGIWVVVFSPVWLVLLVVWRWYSAKRK